MIYFLIFILKIAENTTSTLRLIVVSNGKKLIGAFLNFIMSLIWIISTSLVIIENDFFKMFVFALGCFLGSLLGSFLEEKIAIGSNMLLLVTNKEIDIKKRLDNLSYNSYILNDNILIIIVDRKKRRELLNIIRDIDKNVIVISETAKQLIFK